jgi:hypothetical protein
MGSSPGLVDLEHYGSPSERNDPRSHVPRGRAQRWVVGAGQLRGSCPKELAMPLLHVVETFHESALDLLALGSEILDVFVCRRSGRS